MDATSLGLPKPELTDGGTTTTERQAYKDAWDAQIETADANILSAIGTGGAQVDTAANFTASNPTLNENQFGYESDTGKFKLGDGTTAWNALAYYFEGTGSGDVLGAGTPVVGDIAQYTNVDGKHVSPATRTHYNAVDHGSAVRHASNDIGATFRAWIAGLSNCVVVFPPCAAGTYYNITTDLTIPATVLPVLQRGAVFNTGTVAVSQTLTAAFVAGSNNVTTITGSAFADGIDATILPGQYIKMAVSNNIYRVHSMSGNAGWINSLALASETRAFSASPLTITAAAAIDTELEQGDWLYVSGITPAIPISYVNTTDHVTILTYDWVPAPFSGAAATRSVRVKFLGGIQAGRYQIFTGNGVAKFDQMNTPEVYPEWWGATANGATGNATTNTAAWCRAAICFFHGPSTTETTAGVVRGASGDYNLASPVKYGCATIEGTGSGVYTGKTCFRAAVNPFPGISLLEPYPNIQNVAQGTPQTGSSTPTPNRNLKNIQLYGTNYPCANGLSVDGLISTGGVMAEGITGQLLGNFVRVFSGNLNYFDKCFMSGVENGYVFSNEGYIRGCKGQFGTQILSLGFNLSDWNKGGAGDWTVTGSGASSTITHVKGNTSSLTQNISAVFGTGRYPVPGSQMVLRFTTAGQTIGDHGYISVKCFGTTIRETFWENGTNIIRFVCPNDPWSNPLVFELIPDTDYWGIISDVSVHYGTALYGSYTQGSGNDFWSDDTSGDTPCSGAVGIYPTSAQSTTYGNNVHPVAVGGVWEYGRHYNNNYGACIFGVSIGGYCEGFQAKDNLISGSVNAGIAFPTAGMQSLSEISQNTFQTNAKSFWGGADDSAYPDLSTLLICEENTGVDKGAEIAMEIGTATPNVVFGKRFTLTNGSAQDITNFVNGYLGKEIIIRFMNGNTTIKFSDANHYLKGNSAADWTPATGDILKATFNGSTWDCVKYVTS